MDQEYQMKETNREFKRKRGFFTFAQNGTHDYVRMAYALALSLKATQTDVPYLSIGVTPGQVVPEKYKWAFDEIIEIPWGDAAKTSSWKLENEWKAYHMTPYEETIKLDTDMLFLQNIDLWWDTLAKQDVCAATTALTYRGEVATSDYYRKTFTANKLPNVYTAFMYFKYSDLAKELFDMVEIIYHNWEHFRFEFMQEPRPTELSTDVIFALAMRLIGREDECVPIGEFPNFVHMKTQLQKWEGQAVSEDWTKHIGVYFTDELELKIGRYRQLSPLHYHIKSFLTDEMIAMYEEKLR
jgi:hypothetical protein